MNSVQDAFTSDTKFKGILELTLTKEDGTVEVTTVENLVTTVGLAHIISRLQGTAQAAMGWMAIGTGATAAAVGNTTLGAEVGRVATTVSTLTTTLANDTVQHVGSFGPGVGTGAITEAGIFNIVTANSGTMLNRSVFAVINKGANDTLTVTWKVTAA